MATPALILLVGLLALLTLVRVVLFAVVWFGHLRFRAYCLRKGQPPPPGGGVLLGYFLREMNAMARLGRWHIKGRLTEGLGWSRSRNQGRPVICVHGFTQNGTNFFGLRRFLEERGFPTCAVSLGLPFRHLEAYAPRLEEAIDRMLEMHPEADDFDVVAHSMGGIILRIVLTQRPDLRARARHIITIGSPHEGTAGARGFTFGEDAMQMRRSSVFLKTLPRLDVLCPQATIRTAAARFDYVVYPEETCRVPGAPHRTFERPGHAGLLIDEQVWRFVLSALEEGAGADAPLSS